jgi:hypothetical protein
LRCRIEKLSSEAVALGAAHDHRIIYATKQAETTTVPSMADGNARERGRVQVLLVQSEKRFWNKCNPDMQEPERREAGPVGALAYWRADAIKNRYVKNPSSACAGMRRLRQGAPWLLIALAAVAVEIVPPCPLA